MGVSTALTLARNYPDIQSLQAATPEELAGLEDIGPVVGQVVSDFLASEGGIKLLDSLGEVGFFLDQEDVPAIDRYKKANRSLAVREIWWQRRLAADFNQRRDAVATLSGNEFHKPR